MNCSFSFRVSTIFSWEMFNFYLAIRKKVCIVDLERKDKYLGSCDRKNFVLCGGWVWKFGRSSLSTPVLLLEFVFSLLRQINAEGKRLQRRIGSCESYKVPFGVEYSPGSAANLFSLKLPRMSTALSLACHFCLRLCDIRSFSAAAASSPRLPLPKEFRETHSSQQTCIRSPRLNLL